MIVAIGEFNHLLRRVSNHFTDLLKKYKVGGMTQELANKIWRYEKGELWWREKPRNGIDISKPAGSLDKYDRYHRLFYKGRHYRRSRVVYLMHHGFWPEIECDHINRNRLDDRIENLRAVTRSQNQRNSGINKTSKTKEKYIMIMDFKGHYKHKALRYVFCIRTSRAGGQKAKKLVFRILTIKDAKKDLKKMIKIKKEWFKNNQNLVKQYDLKIS